MSKLYAIGFKGILCGFLWLRSCDMSSLADYWSILQSRLSKNKLHNSNLTEQQRLVKRAGLIQPIVSLPFGP